MWDLTTRRMTTELPSGSSSGPLVLSLDGNLLGLGTVNARGEPAVEVWDVKTRGLRQRLPHPSAVKSLALSPDGTLLATFEDQGTVALVWWAADHTLTNFSVPIPRHDGAGVVDFSPDGSRLAIGRDYGRIDILDWRTGANVAVTNVTEVGEGVYAMACSPTSGLLAAGLGGTIRLWDATSGEPQGYDLEPGHGAFGHRL